MHQTDLFIKERDGTTRIISWEELNQLKKDILWIFDENGTEFPGPFVPEYSFKSKYWEYLTLDGNGLSVIDKVFYLDGTLIIVLCMLMEYIDIEAGDNSLFGETNFDDVDYYVINIQPYNENQNFLKKLVLLGISIAKCITVEDFERNEHFTHPKLQVFIEGTRGINRIFIQPYYSAKLTQLKELDS